MATIKDTDMVSLMELNTIMGNRIRTTLKDDMSPEERQEENELSCIILGFSKQVINLADVVLRAEKLMAQNQDLKESRINKLLGE